MGIGDRRHRVVFQNPVITKDAFGEPDTSYVDLCESWARVRPLEGKELFSEGYAKADVDYSIVTRNRKELKSLGPKDRITWNGHTFDIRAVIFRDHRAADLEILAKEHL